MSKQIAIIGAGLAGLFVAYYLALKENFEIHIFEVQRLENWLTHNTSSSWAAAGMICPCHEIEFEELDILNAGVQSQTLYRNLERELKNKIQFNYNPVIEIALSNNEIPYLERTFHFQKSIGLDVQLLNNKQLKELEPQISTKIPCGIYALNDFQIDQRKLILVLYEILKNKGCKFHFNTPISDISNYESGKYVLPQIEEKFDYLCCALGYQNIIQIPSLPEVYPVRGQMISLAISEEINLNSTIRIQSRTLGKGYIVPKSNRIILGSTSEEMGTNLNCTLGGIMDIITRAYQAIPILYDAEIIETWAGLRPSTLNRKPFIDQEPNSKIFFINGLYRNGVLLSPFAGKYMAEFIYTQKRPSELEPFKLKI